ncbi:MAG: long-chain-fatty-acid--CoA ligase [Nitrospinaceae bacterium]|jgi:acyl-CoA synthetase (AMP-forming)/AMP-acid ligase II|nr:long-chain-fatty-acid--CoA ligase [Nitrospinaceae bacterium]MDP6735251.1 long-chain-fatty-acid--CoA ligase [Nitrospinaceae bacterium]|tara:strand:+ start:3190 stop:4728 length:1539 start_codon:yes stop_codon:yes gene_type:complete
MLVHEILEASAVRLPDKIALIENENELTFAQALSRVEAFSTRLAERGVTKGDRVALLFPNCIEFCIAYFAVVRLGAIAVPLNNRLATKEFTYIINDAGPSTLVVGYQFWETYLSFREHLTHPSQVIYAGDAPLEGIDFLKDLISPVANTLPAPQILPDDPACIMYTSGTTGLPKGAVMSHRNVFTNARNCGAHLNYREDDKTLIVVPLFHVTGLNSQLVAFIYVGGTSVIMRDYNTARMIDLLAKHKVTVTFKVPTMYTLMLANPSLENSDLSALRLAAYGGAPMAPEIIKTLQQQLDVNFYNAYGLTETSSLTTVLPCCDALRKAGAVGLPVSGIRLRVMTDDGREVTPDEIGELWIKGPNVVGAYWNKPQATAEGLGDGWLKTGDFARIDDEGFVFIADRKKDMINRGGENVYSIEVEAALLTNSMVLEAAVVPRPHTIFGETVHAFVVPAQHVQPTEEEIITHCEKLIADYKVPSSVTLVTELPRNPGGKVLKNKLRGTVPPGNALRRE